MKFFSLFPLALFLALMVGCATDSTREVTTVSSDDTTAVPAGTMPEPAQEAVVVPPSPVAPQAQVPPPPPKQAPKPPGATRYPVATAVAGKKGIVKSPYAPYAADVNVRGLPPGSEVTCPHTGKIFVVP